MKALITGGAGFIGSHLLSRLLRDGHSVVVLDNFNDYYDPQIKRENIIEVRNEIPGGDFTVIEGDLLDDKLLSDIFQQQEIEIVYHLGAMAGVRRSIERPELYFDVNVRGTVNLLEAALTEGKPKIIFASSSSVYGGSPRIPFTEDDPVDKPISPYAASKKAGELICHTYHHIHGLDITCLRFFTVYGPRQRPEMAIHLFTRRMLNGKAVPMFGDGSTSRDYTYIDDIIEGVVASGNNCSGYNIYNLGNSDPITLTDLINGIGKATGVEPIIDEKPVPPGDVLRTWADIERSKTDLGYKPCVKLTEGLRRFVEWYKNSR